MSGNRIRKSWTCRFRMTVWGLGVASLAMGALALSSSPAWASPNISGVQFTGDTASNTITMTGSGFGTTPPSGVSDDSNSCGAYTNNGEDYGTNLYIDVVNAGGTFEAGKGTPGSCVGLIIDEWTPTQVVLSFGNAYDSFANWYIATGNSYTINVEGSNFSGTVAFNGSSTTTSCSANTSCTDVAGSPNEDVVVTGTSSTSGSVTIAQAQAILNCGAHYRYLAPINTVSETNFTTTSPLTVVDVLGQMPSATGLKVCYQPLGSSPPPPSFLKRCTHKIPAPCITSIAEVDGTAVATLQVPANDPRFWTTGGLPIAKKLVPSSGPVGTTVTLKGSDLSEALSVTVGSTPAKIKSLSPTKLKFVVPSGAQSGPVTVMSSAGDSTTSQTFTVTG
jgi:hypothetical protein